MLAICATYPHVSAAALATHGAMGVLDPGYMGRVVNWGGVGTPRRESSMIAPPFTSIPNGLHPRNGVLIHRSSGCVM